MKATLTVFLFFLLNLVFGQAKKVEFFGYRLIQYQNPVLVGDNMYKSYYKLIGETFSNGRFELDESHASFLIKWANSDDWLAKYSKKITTKGSTQDLELGDVVQVITYSGRWVDDNDECELRILQTANNQCVIELRSGKAIDTDKNINDWKKIFRFFVRGCFDSLPIPAVNESLLQEKLKAEIDNVKKSISEKRIFGGEEISEGAKFIGNPSELLEFYQKTPSNSFTVSLLIDELGNYKFQNIGRGYIPLSKIDTSYMRRVLKFIPAKKILVNDTFLVRSSIILSFAQRNDDGIHHSPVFSASGIIKKKSSSIQLVSIDPSDKKQIVVDNVITSDAFHGKESGTYNFKFQALAINVDIFIYDIDGRNCYSKIANRSAVVKNIFDFYGQREDWQISY